MVEISRPPALSAEMDLENSEEGPSSRAIQLLTGKLGTSGSMDKRKQLPEHQIN